MYPGNGGPWPPNQPPPNQPPPNQQPPVLPRGRFAGTPLQSLRLADGVALAVAASVVLALVLFLASITILTPTSKSALCRSYTSLTDEFARPGAIDVKYYTRLADAAEHYPDESVKAAAPRVRALADKYSVSRSELTSSTSAIRYECAGAA